jgi:hypothetical protein
MRFLDTEKYTMQTLLVNVLRWVLLAAPIVPAHAAFVNKNDPGCSDVVGAPFCTIQAAINAAPPNGFVSVVNGVYQKPSGS